MYFDLSNELTGFRVCRWACLVQKADATILKNRTFSILEIHVDPGTGKKTGEKTDKMKTGSNYV